MGDSASANPAWQHSVTFWDRVCAIPLFKSTVNVYVKSKQLSGVVGTGLDVLESGVRLATIPVKTIASSVVTAYPQRGKAFLYLMLQL